MNQQKAKDFLPLIKAWSEGKTLQFRESEHYNWNNIHSMEEKVLSKPDNYRIKPTPTLRPWRPEEVPVGALIHGKAWNVTERGMIIHVYSTKVSVAPRYEFDLKELFTDCEHSTDGGKTWHPCGVVE